MYDSLVLITDVFTHLGFRTLVTTLKAGHCVVAIIQNEEQIKKIASSPSVTPYGIQVNFSVVKDVTAPGAFEHCMKGVTHVIHNAELAAPPPPQAGKGKQRQQVGTPHAVQERSGADVFCCRPRPNASTTLRAEVRYQSWEQRAERPLFAALSSPPASPSLNRAKASSAQTVSLATPSRFKHH